MRLSALLLSLVVLLSACSRGRTGARAWRPPAVLTQQIEPTSRAPLRTRGTIQAGSRLHLGFKLPGVVTAVLVDQGDAVTKGQVLARLDQTDARSQVRAAGATRNKARRDWLRAQSLVKSGALAAVAAADARSGAEAADANLAIALEAFRRTTLISPVSGKVVERLAQPGESLVAGARVLVVDEAEHPVVKVGVTGRDLERVAVGGTAVLELEDGSPPFDGEVISVAPTPSPADGLYAVELRPAKDKLQSGALIAVRFQEETQALTIRVPLDVLVRRNDKDWVFVVDESGGKTAARQRAVRLGRSEGQQIAVLEGLAAGDRIITEGGYFLRDGQAVRVVEGP